MGPGPDRATGVVEEQSEIEHVRVLEFFEEIPVGAQFRILGLHHLVELVDADQGVFVRGITMEKFVLDQAGELPEFRDVSSEEIDPVHHSKDTADVSFAGEDPSKYLAQRFAAAKRARDQPEISREE